MNTIELLASAHQHQKSHRAAPSKSAPQAREKVRVAWGVVAGAVRNGRRVSGVGREWIETVADHDACVWGLEPGRSHRVRFQYAYLEG